MLVFAHFLPGGQQLVGQSKLFYGPGGCPKERCLGGAEGCCGVWGPFTWGLQYLGAAKDKGMKVTKLGMEYRLWD